MVCCGLIKGNIGHLDAAAGIAGLIKTALSLYYQVIPPSINYSQANQEIDFETLLFCKYSISGLAAL